jgi:hypothetical protein
MFLFRKPVLARLFLCLLFFPLSNLHAQKILGADINYKYLGNDSMWVRLVIYLRCDGKTSNFKPGDLLVKPKASSPFKVALSLSGGQDISPVSKGKCTSCMDTGCSFKKGIQMYFSDAWFSLKNFNDCEFTFSWQAMGREINGKGIYVEAMYERCAVGSHSSPYLTNPPIQVVCKNTRVMHVVPGDDQQWGDSISFHLIPPRITADTAYSYPTGYDYQNPLTVSADGFVFDVETGAYTFQPTKVESSPIAVRIDEYRKDSTGNPVKIGSITHDIQYDVMDCGQVTPPVSSGINCQNAASMNFCANRSQCFTICSFDADSATDTVTLFWNNAVPGGKFTVEEGKKFPKANFCWTPTDAHVSTIPYRMIISAMDGQGQIRNVSQKVFSFYVKPNPKGIIKKTYDKYGWVTLEAIVTNYISVKAYYWNGQYRPRNAMVNLPGGKVKVQYAPDPNQTPTKYPLYLTIVSKEGCETIITDTVVIDSSLYVDLGADTTVCVNTSLKLNAKRYFGKPNFLYSWQVYNDATKVWDTKVNKVKDDTTYSITADKTKHVVVSVIDGGGGQITDTIHVFAQKPPAPFLGADVRGCAGEIIILDGRKDISGQKMPKISKLEWYKYDGTGGWKSLVKNPTLPVKDSGMYRVVVTDSFGCAGSDEIHVDFNPPVEVKRATYTVCKGDTARLNGGAAGAGTTWKWYIADSTNGALVSVSQFYHFMPPQTGPVREWKFRVAAKQTIQGVACQDEDTITVILDTSCTRPCTTKLHSKDTSICRGDTINVYASGGTSYQWIPGTGVSDTLSANPKIYTSVTRTYSVIIRDSIKKCLDTFSVTITVDSNCVWPGDANYDKIADYKDVLTIGVGYGKTGYSRDSISIAWQAFPSKAWTQKLASGVNYKHIDCNGDGTIDLKDVKAVSTNYGNKHKKSGEPELAGANDPTVAVLFTNDTFYAGDTVHAELYAGTIQNPLVSAYGIGLDLTADAPFIVPGSLSFDFSCNTFCNTNNPIFYLKVNGAQAEGALVRTDHAGVNGSHKIGDIGFILKDSATYNYSSSGDLLSVSMNELILIDTTGASLPINQDMGVAIVLKKRSGPVGIKPGKSLEKEIRVYPNPAKDILTVETGMVKVSEIVLYNAVGQRVFAILKPQNGRIQIPVTGFTSGMYFISASTEEGKLVRKIIIR